MGDREQHGKIGKVLSQRFPERMTILLNHGEGLLARLFEAQRAVEAKEGALEILAEKTYETQVKAALKKFPNCESLKVEDGIVSRQRERLIQGLLPHYFVMVDAMEFQSHYLQLLGSMSEVNMTLNISVNFPLTALFLDLMQTYVSVMLMLSRFSERKAVAMVFNTVYALSKGGNEPMYGRLQELLAQQEQPLKVFSHMFRPYINLFSMPLGSLLPIFTLSNLNAKDMRKQNILNLTQNLAKLGEFAKPENISQFTLSLDRLAHWISFGYCLIPEVLQNENVQPAVMGCLTDGFVLTLFRTESIATHAMYDTVLSSVPDPKAFSKLKSTFVECVNGAIGSSPGFHADRRLFLRQTLSQILALMKDKPGLLGPKIAVIVKALTLAKDEIHWLLRHAAAPVPKSKTKLNQKLLQDNNISELVFGVCELTALLREYSGDLKKYFAEYMNGDINTTINETSAAFHLTSHEHDILTGFFETLSECSPDAKKDGSSSLEGFRMDWLRLQSSMSFGHSPYPLNQHLRFSAYATLASFLSDFLEDLDSALVRYAMPVLYCFHQESLQKSFQHSLDSPAHQRFVVAWVQLLDCFSYNGTEFLPDERVNIGKSATELGNKLLTMIAFQTTLAANQMAIEHVELGKELLPTEAVKSGHSKRKKDKSGQNQKDSTPTRSPERIDNLEALQLSIADLCWALNHHVTVDIFNCTYSPREYLATQLSQKIPAIVVEFCRKTDADAPVRPSEALNKLQSFMASYRSLESYINIDISGLFARILLQQTTCDDTNGPTIARIYSDFFISALFTTGYNGGILHSASQQCLTGTHANADMQHYTSITELKALCSLVGPFGVKELCEGIVSRVSTLIKSLKEVTSNNPRIPEIAAKLHSTEATNDAVRSLRDMDVFFKMTAGAGLGLNFRRMLLNALKSVLEDRIPFVYTTIRDLHKHVRGSESVDLLALMGGLTSELDPALLKHFRQYVEGTDPNLFRSLNIFFGVCLRFIAVMPGNSYNTQRGTHEGNAACVARAVVDISSTLIALIANNPQTARAQITLAQKEILRVASVLLLRLTFNSKESARNKNAALVIMYEIIKESPFLTADVLEEFMPYSLIRCAHHALLKGAKQSAVSGDEVVAS